jgi:hypothetical protein
MDALAILLLAGIAFYFLAPQAFSDVVSEVGNIPTGTNTDTFTFLGGTLSPSQIAGYAQNAGWSGADLVTATAIALAESSGNPAAPGDIDNPVQGAQSYGLWQINSYYHPECGPNFSALYDPQTNANCAFGIYQRAGNSFAPWTGTYTNGVYLKYVPTVQQALGVSA